MRILLNEEAFIRGQKYNEVPESLRVNGRYLLQQQALLGAEAVAIVHRKNMHTQIRFLVARQHGTQEKAGEFLMTHLITLPNRAVKVTFVMEDPKTHGLAFELDKAAVRSVGGWTEGTTSWMDYEDHKKH